MIYCFDTSSFIHAAERVYPIDHFASVWAKLDQLAAAGRLIAPDEVLREIERKSGDALHEWVKTRPGIFAALDRPQQEAVRAILNEFPRLIDSRKGKSGGDPFVVALAKHAGATVVTEESFAGPERKSPRIPDVCAHYGIRWINLLAVVRHEGWRF